ncbi:MAG: hypothetical protein WBA25_04050, partial [Jannaschia sp.]
MIPHLSRQVWIAIAACALLLTLLPFALGRSATADTVPLIVVPQPGTGRVAVHIVFATGDAAPGLAHYAEHLAWLNAVGSRDRAADRHSNAWTRHGSVGYWLSGPPDALPELLGNVVGVLRPIDLPRPFAEEEREIVMREYDLRVGGNVDARADEAVHAFLHAGNPSAASVIGTPDQIRALDYDAARAFHAATHRIGNARILIVGDVLRRQARQAVAALDLPPDEGKPLPAPTFTLGPPDRDFLTYPETGAVPRLIWQRIVALDEAVPFDLLEARAALLRDILDTRLPGGLAKPLRYDAEISRRFEVEIWPLDERYVTLRITAEPDRGVSLTEMQAAFEAALTETAAAGIPAGTHARVLERFDGFWPDWTDDGEVALWMGAYTIDRAVIVRAPLDRAALAGLAADLTPPA